MSLMLDEDVPLAHFVMATGVATLKDWGKSNANCYAWAANCSEPHGDGRPEPGLVSGLEKQKKYDANSLIDGAVADGMTLLSKSVDNMKNPLKNTYVVALYLQENGGDFHWLRHHDQTGRWSHKIGARDPQNFDEAWQIIDAPPAFMVMAKARYDFVAFFAVPNGGITVGSKAK